jgi:subtilisin family serine protease
MAGKRLWRSLVAVVAAFGVVATFAASTEAAPRVDAAAHSASAPELDAALFAEAWARGSVEVIVQVERLEQKWGVLASLDGLEYRQVRSYDKLPYLALEVAPEALIQLTRAPGVVAVSANTLDTPSLASTLPIINGDDVQALGWTGAGRTVAVLDTGIDADHPFFAGRLVAQACFSGSSGNTLCPNGMTTDTSADIEPGGTLVANCAGNAGPCEHGTHVAGIAAGSAASDPANAPGNGVAPGANIIAVQVFSRFTDSGMSTPCATAGATSPCILTSVADQISGLNWVLGQLGTFPTIDAVNMSLGGGMNTTACDGDTRKAAIDALLAAGVATVISSGNNGFLNAVGAPGCISTAVTVGATDDADNVTRNRGTLLDIFAPGSNVDSSGYDDVYVSKGGTSMAAPHVTGAFAIMREAYPTLTIGQILTFLQTNGVPITYPINMANPPATTTTPRLDLLASLQANSQPPTLTVDTDPVNVDEGDLATNTGTFDDTDGDPVTLSASVGTVVDAGGGTWSWSYQTSDGPVQSQSVTISGTDDKGVSGSVTFDLVVDNVAPDVAIDASQVVAIDEGGTLDVLAHFVDPGWPDTYTATIDWGTPAGDTSAATVSVTTAGPPDDVGTASGSFTYGDNGQFTVTVTVTDDDGGSGSDSFVVTVGNVDPTAEIDPTGTVLINGVPTFLASAGDPVVFSGTSHDPGSDDLTLTWDWDDGTTDSTTLLNDPTFDPDPFPSPEVHPRNVTNMQTHTFDDACLYVIEFRSEDDDAGSATDEANVLIVGNADERRSAGYWYQQFRRLKDFSASELDCYLEMVNFASGVFSEETSLTTFAQAQTVLKGGGPVMEDIFDRQLLAAWLNFANGAVAWDALIDTNGDSAGDTAFSDVISGAEAVRLGPHTRAELEEQKDLLESISLDHS